MKKRKTRETIRVGKADTDIETPSHTRGNRKGNKPGSYEKMPGHNPDGTSTAARSTGVSPESKNPISPDMPNLSPA